MYTTSDRRLKPRITCDYPAVIKGRDVRGNKYEESGKLANLSASGLFMWVNRDIPPGSRLTITVYLSSPGLENKSHKLSTNCIVVRTEPHASELCGVAVKFTSYRFH